MSFVAFCVKDRLLPGRQRVSGLFSLRRYLFGSSQMPLPVRRIAPNPRRFTSRSPILNVFAGVLILSYWPVFFVYASGPAQFQAGPFRSQFGLIQQPLALGLESNTGNYPSQPRNPANPAVATTINGLTLVKINTPAQMAVRRYDLQSCSVERPRT